MVVRDGLRGTDFLSAEQAWECDKINYRDPHKAAVLNHRALRKTFTLRARQGLFHIENGIRSPSNESMSLTVLLYTRRKRKLSLATNIASYKITPSPPMSNSSLKDTIRFG